MFAKYTVSAEGADYDAADLFASGNNILFDDIPVLHMSLENQYLHSDFYPKNESHLSLNIENLVQIVLVDRYRKVFNFNKLVLAN